MAIPLLDQIGDIRGKDITADALLTQRRIAEYITDQRHAHYHFTVKGNQAGLRQDIEQFFKERREPDFIDRSPSDHGRIETRKIWTTTELNGYLQFPHVGQSYVIERESIRKKDGAVSRDIAYGITSRCPEEAGPSTLLAINRNHWSIENSCHYIIDWNYDEDRSRIRTGNGPENMTRLRRFCVGLLSDDGDKTSP
ncbi:MAG: ISAs1 family transposase [Marinilabiliales bacterium]|nr:ISAs1 family transposase [Marinilabiliales bacterium]